MNLHVCLLHIYKLLNIKTAFEIVKIFDSTLPVSAVKVTNIFFAFVAQLVDVGKLLN